MFKRQNPKVSEWAEVGVNSKFLLGVIVFASLIFIFNTDNVVAEENVDDSAILWTEGKIKWLETSYPSTGTGVIQLIDPDMNLDPEAVDNFDVDVWSDSDAGGIDLTMTETNVATGIFEGTVFFTTTGESSGHRLRVAGEDTITAEYEDNTLPEPYATADELDITSTSIIQKIPPTLKMQNDWGYGSDEFGCWYESSVLVERPNGKHACVYPYTAAKLNWEIVINSTNSNFIETKVGDYDIFAHFSRGVTGNTITYDENYNSLIIDTFARSNGTLSLAMPTTFIDMQTAYCSEPRSDDDYFVLIDGEEVAIEREISDDAMIYLEISYPTNGGRIEIIATCPI